MSTRGLYGLRRDGIDKTTYNHSDSYPEWLGKKIAEFCSQVSIGELNTLYDNIVLVDENGKPDQKQVALCKERGWFNDSVSSGSDMDWYCLLRNLQGNFEELQKAAKGGYEIFMTEARTFIMDSLFCEYAYIINLDDRRLEFWVGYQKVPQEGNRYGEASDGSGYFPCKLVRTFPLGRSFVPDKVLQGMIRGARR